MKRLLIGAIFLSITAYGQEIYTDVSPDVELIVDASNPSAFFDVDFNNDAQADIKLYVKDTTINGIPAIITALVPLNLNETAGLDSTVLAMTNFTLVKNLSSGSAVNSQLSFVNDSITDDFTDPIINYSGLLDLTVFENGMDQFIGVKLNFSGNIHYGWIQVYLDNQTQSLTIRDFAYQSTPNGEIVIPQGATANILNIVHSNKKEPVKIIDLMGRVSLFKPNTPLIFIYQDGTSERVMKIEE
jgi:hypothetical protein